ncbi:MAG TPA: hypothetical protein VER39_03555 [Nocardioidaceae bacterium]|nr:hypothetical protein [Nocardioidaceae bacterium]
MRSHLPIPVARWVALTLTTAMGLSACSGGADGGSESAGATSSPGSSASASASSGSATVLESPSASSTVPVPQGTELTAQGTELSFGAPATVIYEPRRNRGSVLTMNVRRVQRGKLADFAGFILDDAYKRGGAYYYATVSVRNVGRGDVGGVPVPLWGVNAKNTLLPAVSFTTRFPACPSRPLPARFPPGASLTTCLVYLSPDRGALTSVSYRPTQQFDPVTWVGPVTAAKKPNAKKPNGKKPNAKKQAAKKPNAKKQASGR